MELNQNFSEDLDRFEYLPEIHPPCDIGLIPKLEHMNMSLDNRFKINQSQLFFFNSLPGQTERRLRDMCNVPFEL